jgi:hypothetical protein
MQIQAENNARFVQLQQDNATQQAELRAENAQREAAMRQGTLAREATQTALFERMSSILEGQIANRTPDAAPAAITGTRTYNPLFATILELHPHLDESLVKEIYDQTFKPENLLKLSSSSFYVPGASKRRREEITLGTFTIPTSDKKVSPDEYTSAPQLLQSLSLCFSY